MREYLFRGKRVANDQWVYGSYVYQYNCHLIYLPSVDGDGFDYYHVYPESVGQYTGMNEFVMSDRSYNKPLFEGDIVEVWSRRRPPTENIYIYRDKPTSKYDVEVKARAIIRFKYGRWFLDYDNKYNESLCKLQGNEQYERTVKASNRLYDFGFHHGNEEWHREHNARCKGDDIVKIGTEFENPELLEV